MKLTERRFTEKEAKQLCLWRYPAPYDIYNFSDWEAAVKNQYAIASEQRRAREFCAVYSDGDFVGFYRTEQRADCVIIGLGLRPDFCARGYGGGLVALAVSAAQSKCPQLPVCLEVRTFNARAIACYLRVGFAVVRRYVRETPVGEAEFYLMRYSAE